MTHGDDIICTHAVQEAKQLWERAADADFQSSDLALVLEARALLETPNGTTTPPPATPLASLAATPTVSPAPPEPATAAPGLAASQPPAGVPAPSEPAASSATELQVCKEPGTLTQHENGRECRGVPDVSCPALSTLAYLSWRIPR